MKKKTFWLFDTEKKEFQNKANMTQQEADELNKSLKEPSEYTGWINPCRWVVPEFPDLNGRHVASLRSMCETFGTNGQFMCVCGAKVSDKIHFRTKEIDKLSPEARVVAFL